MFAMIRSGLVFKGANLLKNSRSSIHHRPPLSAFSSSSSSVLLNSAAAEHYLILNPHYPRPDQHIQRYSTISTSSKFTEPSTLWSSSLVSTTSGRSFEPSIGTSIKAYYSTKNPSEPNSSGYEDIRLAPDILMFWQDKFNGIRNGQRYTVHEIRFIAFDMIVKSNWLANSVPSYSRQTEAPQLYANVMEHLETSIFSTGATNVDTDTLKLARVVNDKFDKWIQEGQIDSNAMEWINLYQQCIFYFKHPPLPPDWIKLHREFLYNNILEQTGELATWKAFERELYTFFASSPMNTDYDRTLKILKEIIYEAELLAEDFEIQ